MSLVRHYALLAVVVLVASWQVTARSEDPNATALAGTESVLTGTAGDLAQYRPLSHLIARGLQLWLNTSIPPYESMRFVQCLLIFGLAYAYYRALGLQYRTRVIGLAIVAGFMSLNLGPLGPSAFSLDRFTDTIFYLIAGLLVLYGLWAALPVLMIAAVANRETSVFMPMFMVARFWTDLLTRRSLLVITALSWLAAAATYLAIHTYYGPRPRTEHSYWGADMFLNSLSMPAQVSWLFAAINLLPLVAILAWARADPFLRRLFWLVVPLWLVIHIWAARMGEGIMYLAPFTVILLPMVLQAVSEPARLRCVDAVNERS